MLESALAYAAAGWPVLPLHSVSELLKCTCGNLACSSPGKHPIPKNGVKDATTNAAQVSAWFETYPWANVGIATGTAAGFFVVDVDPRHEGHMRLRELEVLRGDLPATLTARTGGGGEHLFFRVPLGQRLASKLAPGVDIKSDGGYIVAPPSRHVSGQLYAWPVGELPPIAEPPEWLLVSLRRKRAAGTSTKSRKYAEGGRNTALASFAGVLRAQGFAFEGMLPALLAENAAHCNPPLSDEEVAAVAKSVSMYAPEPTAIAVRAQEECNAWMTRLALDKNGNTKRTLGNCRLIFENDEKWLGALGFNARKQQHVLVKPPPYDRVWKDAQLIDEDFTLAAVWVEREYGITPAPAAVANVLMALARANPFDPVADYLCGLEHDGVARIDTWLSTYCGAVDSAETRAIGAKWLVSAVARACDPGCKADHMLMFVGKQGVGKSRTFAILGGEWFSDDIADFGSKAAAEQLQGPWIVELSELSATRKADQETIKAFATRQSDNYRAAYGRVVQERPRRCVLAGTTNDYDFMVDQTGGRRFWPVVVGKVEQEALRRDRDQLWAEAAVRWCAGEVLYLETDELQAAMEVRQLEHTQVEAWEERIAEYVERRTATTTRAVCDEVLYIQAKDQNGPSTRIGKILRRLGWRPLQARNPQRNGAPTRLFVHPNVRDVADIEWTHIPTPREQVGPRLTAIAGGKVRA